VKYENGLIKNDKVLLYMLVLNINL